MPPTGGKTAVPSVRDCRRDARELRLTPQRRTNVATPNTTINSLGNTTIHTSGRRGWVGRQAKQEGNEETVRTKGTAERNVGRWGGRGGRGHRTNSSVVPSAHSAAGEGRKREGGAGHGRRLRLRLWLRLRLRLRWRRQQRQRTACNGRQDRYASRAPHAAS